MPRTSKAALAATPVSLVARLAPPFELNEAEAAVFRQTVAAVPPDFFRAEDLVLLAGYSRAAVLERLAAAQLAAAMAADGKTGPPLAVYTQVSRTLMNLTVRLRLGPRARDPTHRRRSATAMRRVDREALRRAIQMVKAELAERRWILDKIRDDGWEDAALSAVYHCQVETLHLRPWQPPPCWADEDHPRDDHCLGAAPAAAEGRPLQVRARSRCRT